MSAQNPVRALNAEVARKIAAGEVIDRPSAIVRELMDNAIDSGADSITVELSGGGIEKIRVVDNGCGMTREDLQSCAHPHATSKISTETDLMNLSTLGFRGEALASIAAVARLSITSGGWKMRASITEDHVMEPTAQTNGTIVQSEGLFENFPARRQFLKRPASEGVMCRNIFIEKTLARPDIAFRLIADGDVKLDLPKGQTLTQRFIYAASALEDAALFSEISGSQRKSSPDWEFKAVIGEPAVSRTTKKDILIYANGRRIQEYSLVQAVEYGGQGFFPNGTYPVAAVFVTVNPRLIDFNIHPAKKEARFYDISELHHALSSTIKNFFLSYTRRNFENDKPADYTQTLSLDKLLKQSERPRLVAESAAPDSSRYENHISYRPQGAAAAGGGDFRSRFLGLRKNDNNEMAGLVQQALSNATQEQVKIQEAEEKPVRFIGCALGTFLLAEKNSCLYIIDQHAVHERLLFDKLMSRQGKRQALLIPYKIRTSSRTQDAQLERLKERLNDIGFATSRIEDGLWEVSSIPERWTGTEHELKTLLLVRQVEPEEIIRSIAAMTACKAAVKDGYVLDDETAARLAEQAFTLPDPHCPHGRPVYTVISRETLFQLVKRT